MTPKHALKEEKELIAIYRKEYDAFKHQSASLARRLDLQALRTFYDQMQRFYEVYRYHDQGFVSSVETTCYGDRSLDTLVRYCHLSPWVLIEDDDYPKVLGIFRYYLNSLRPEIQHLAKTFLTNNRSEAPVPF